MTNRLPILLVWAVLYCGTCFAQGVMSDVLTGKLVNPEKGAWAWYDLSDTASDQKLVMRLAIVDEERVGLKKGYWLELEVVPMLGYRSVFKMLVTGPASDPRNLHKVLVREGLGSVQEMPVAKDEAKGESPPEAERTLVGKEELALRDGSKIDCEHYELAEGGDKVEVWLNDKVRPMGIVRMSSSAGDLTLRNYGLGGQDARSVINDPLPAGLGGQGEEMKVEVDTLPAAPGGPAAPAENSKTPKPNRRGAE